MTIRRPILSRQARYRRDTVRGEHQLVFPEGVLVLNETGAAVVRHCDGRSVDELTAALELEFEQESLAAEVQTFLGRLARKGLICEAGDA